MFDNSNGYGVVLLLLKSSPEKGVETSQVTLVVEKGVMVGNIRVTGAFYQVRYVEDGTHVIYQINAQAFPPDSEPLETR